MAVEKITYFEFLEYRLDLEKQQLLKNNDVVSLTHKAFQILHLLVQNSGQITRKEDIFSELWSDSFVEDGNLTQHIYVLRRALGKLPDGQTLIETVPRKGYRFTLPPEQITIGKIQSAETAAAAISDSFPPQGEIYRLGTNDDPRFSGIQSEEHEITNDAAGIHDPKEQLGDSAEEQNSSGEIAAAQQPAAVGSQKKTGASLFTLRQLSIAGAALLCFCLISLAAYHLRLSPLSGVSRQKNQNDVFVAGESEQIKSIAVLPFRPIGEEIDKEKLGLGMSDAVIARLSNLRQITVRPTSSVFRYADRAPETAVSAGQELGVDSVLEGTVQWDGEKVRVSVQMVRVSDGKTLWADSFQEKMSDIFALQDSISAKVAATLSLNLNERQQQILTRHPTASHEAFQAYQMGVYFWNRRTKEDLHKAVEYFQKAVEIDPAYAQAYAALADAFSMIAYYRYANVDEMKENARAAAEKALSLDDSLAEAHIALGIVYAIKKENFARAQELFERAVQLAPYSSVARHRHAWILLMNGRLNEGAWEMRLAREYDPLSPATNRAYCSVLIMQRNFPEAVKECEARFQIYQGTPNSRRALARAFFYNGNHAGAIKQLEMQLASGTGDEKMFARANLAFFYAKLGRKGEAQKIYADLKKEFDRKKGFARDPQQAGDLALIGFELEKKDEAAFYFAELSKLLEEYADMALSLYYDPYWDEMKKDPSFAPLFPKAPAMNSVPGNSQTDAPRKIY